MTVMMLMFLMMIVLVIVCHIFVCLFYAGKGTHKRVQPGCKVKFGDLIE